MKKYLRLSIMLLLVLVVVVGCSNDDKGKDNQGKENTAKETSGEKTDDKENNEDRELSLGETGTMKSTVGEYEVTPTAFEIVESRDGQEPINADKGNMFIIVDITVKNIGDTILDGTDISKVDLFDANGSGMNNRTNFEFVDYLEGEIKPGEEVSGQLLFMKPRTDYYKLIFGYALESVSTKITWHLDADEAK